MFIIYDDDIFIFNFFLQVLKKADMIRKNAVESILAERDILISVLNPFVVIIYNFFGLSLENIIKYEILKL